MINKKKFIIVIPARYKSKRLPGKPLISLKGIPMIIRTCMRVAKAVPKEKILVATDDYRIIKICQKYNQFDRSIIIKYYFRFSLWLPCDYYI